MVLNGLSHIANKVEARHIIWKNKDLIEILSDISQNGSMRHWRKAAYIFCLITRPDTEKYIEENILKSIIKLFKSPASIKEYYMGSALALSYLGNTKWANYIASDSEILKIISSNKKIQIPIIVKNFLVIILNSLKNDTFLREINDEYKQNLIEYIDKLSSCSGGGLFDREFKELSCEAKEILN